jgi:hypothetical protein
MRLGLWRHAVSLLLLVSAMAASALLSCATRMPVAEAEEQGAVLVGAGDIADCSNLSGAEATEKLLAKIPGTVMAIGDLAYPDGKPENFACYDRTWGKEKSRTKPAVGNHEFHSAGATYYFQYFGAAAGDPHQGYYSYELGTWHIVVLNSECAQVGGCDEGSDQVKWLKADLASHPALCTLAYFHKPMFSSGGTHGDDWTLKPLWEALYAAGADVVVGAHDHDYERFVAQTPEGKADPSHGIREFVAGTGGKNQRPFGTPESNSEVRNANGFGVLKFTLLPGRYWWEFIPEEGKTFRDAGEDSCH